jgi:cardiolipin synthase
VQLDRANAVLSFVIIGREIAISALREWMAQIGASKSVAVSSIGKIKTTAQMMAIPLLLFHDVLWGAVDTQFWGSRLLEVAALLTVWSMFYYLRLAWPLIKEKAGSLD